MLNISIVLMALCGYFGFYEHIKWCETTIVTILWLNLICGFYFIYGFCILTPEDIRDKLKKTWAEPPGIIINNITNIVVAIIIISTLTNANYVWLPAIHLIFVCLNLIICNNLIDNNKKGKNNDNT